MKLWPSDRAVTLVFDTAPVRFASAEDLIIHRLGAGRPRDVEDVAGVPARSPLRSMQGV
jgi:hypothetical protein